MKRSNLIVIPTFNESENISKIIGDIRKEKVAADVLVVDDNSPDGTGRIVLKLAVEDHGLHLLSRKVKEGLGRAYVAGFKWGMEKGYKKFTSMDADSSHPVEALSRLLNICDTSSVAIGSRYIKGGKIVGWNTSRYINSWGANYITRLLLRIRAKDATAGFKCYPVEFFKRINLDTVEASGYAFQVEMALKAQQAGFQLIETPITFTDRVAGESKIRGELKKSAKMVLKFFIAQQGVRQFVKFAIVGAINTGVDWAVFFSAKILLLSWLPNFNLQTIRQIAKAISFIVSATSSYIMNRKWTFRSANARIMREAGKFLVVGFGGLVINSSVFYLVTARLHWRDIFGLISATAGATLWNFFANRNWTFKQSN